jgi:2-oxoglutarate ferredoxin oxidoreductase subunit beta
VELEHGKPLIFGKDRDKGIRMIGGRLEIVKTSEVPADDLLIHDETSHNSTLHYMLSRMRYPEFPEPIGVLRAVEGVATYDDQINDQVRVAQETRGRGDLQKLFNSGDTWQVA